MGIKPEEEEDLRLKLCSEKHLRTARRAVSKKILMNKTSTKPEKDFLPQGHQVFGIRCLVVLTSMENVLQFMNDIVVSYQNRGAEQYNQMLKEVYSFMLCYLRPTNSLFYKTFDGH